MPGDLRDPEQFQQWYYDNRYDVTPNMSESGVQSVDGYLQSIAIETVGRKINPILLAVIKQKLTDRGLFSLNPGDEFFRNEVKKLLMTRKILSKCLIIC